MYKLVAFDLDNTLFTNDKQLPPGFFYEARRLTEKGIVCAPASGRFVSELRELFAPVADSLGFIGCNAHEVYLGDRMLHRTTFDDEILFAILDACSAIPDVMVDFTSPETNFVMGYEGTAAQDALLRTYYSSWERMDMPTKHIHTWGDAPIVKVTCVNPAPWESTEQVAHISPRVRPVLTAAHTCNFALDGASKATGLAMLAKELGIPMEETMAFGDHMNDIEMIEAAGCGVAMANAIPEVKAVANRECPSNEEYGVMSVLAQL